MVAPTLELLCLAEEVRSPSRDLEGNACGIDVSEEVIASLTVDWI
jgi:hypothetical protein